MIMSSDLTAMKRATLLNQLRSEYERESQLYVELSDLIAEEVSYSGYLLQVQSVENPRVLRMMTSEIILKFRERASVIMPGLQDTHHKIKTIFDELCALHPEI